MAKPEHNWSCEMSARDATPSDIEPIMRLSLDMHKESNFRHLSLNKEKLRNAYLTSIKSPDKFLLQVYEYNSSIVGFLFGTLQKPFFTDELVAADLVFYVDPKHRGGLSAYRLWRHFREWACNMGASEIRQGITTGVSPERTHRFFEKVGMELTGQNYRFDLRPAADKK